MEKEEKLSISKNFTKKSLSFMLLLSVVATLLGFATAYNEHRGLIELQSKYEESIEKIESCEISISALSQQLAQQQTKYSDLSDNSTTTYNEDFSQEASENTAEETTAPPNNTKDTVENTSTAPSSAVSSGKYYVTKSGSKYHIGTCSFLSKSKIAITTEQIKAEGYTPCSRCIK